MSPLARSLLALGALLAAADATCTSNIHGNDTDHVVLLGPYEVPAQDTEKGKLIHIEDFCKPGKPVGVTISACNSHSSRNFAVGPPPTLTSNLTQANVRCDDHACPTGVHVQIMQYCDSGKTVARP